MDILHNFSHSPFSLEQFICISTNHPGCRNIHWDMEVQTQWRCAQETQRSGLTCVCSFSLSLYRPTCWQWKHTDHRSEIYICCAIWHIGNPKDVVLQHTSGMHGERQDSGSLGEQRSSFYHHLGSGCSV